MRWKLVVLVSIVAALVASLCWFLLIILFFDGSRAILPLGGELWPLSLVLPLLLAVFGGFFVYRHTSRRRKTQATMTVLAVLTLTALVCFAVILLLRSRTVNLTLPVLLSVPSQSPSAPESANRSQTECARRVPHLTPERPGGYLRG